MRKLVLGGAAVAAVVALGSAQAADLAPTYKAPAIVPPPVLSWTGLYLVLRAVVAGAMKILRTIRM